LSTGDKESPRAEGIEKKEKQGKAKKSETFNKIFAFDLKLCHYNNVPAMGYRPHFRMRPKFIKANIWQ
jgi:hypothetical protein